MGSVNKVILVGNLTRDPEMKRTEGKKPVCIIELATNRYWTDEKGQRHEEPEFHRIVAWDKLAETCHQFFYGKAEKSTLRSGCKPGPILGRMALIVLEKLEMLDSMPQDVRQRMELEDALADTSNGAPAQQI